MPDIDREPSCDYLDLAQDVRTTLQVAVHMLRVLDHPGDLSTAQVSVLNTLASGAAKIGDLAKFGGVTQPGMSQLISRLESLKLVKRTGSDSDARVTLVQITTEGRCTLETVNRKRNGILASFLEQLDVTDIEQLRAGLNPLTLLAADVVQHRTDNSTDISTNNARS